MDLDDYCERLDEAFARQKERASLYVEEFNATLPTSYCPKCQESGHCPGLACPSCGYKHHPSLVIARSGEWGTEIVALNNQRTVLARFDVEE